MLSFKHSSTFLHIPAADEPFSCRLCAVVKPLPLYHNGTLKRGDKGDYIYKTFGALGVHSLQELRSTLLAKRFPSFARMMYVPRASNALFYPYPSRLAEMT